MNNERLMGLLWGILAGWGMGAVTYGNGSGYVAIIAGLGGCLLMGMRTLRDQP